MAESQKLTILSLEKEKDQLQTKYSSMQQGREELEERVASTKKEVEVVSRQVDVLKNQLRDGTFKQDAEKKLYKKKLDNIFLSIVSLSPCIYTNITAKKNVIVIFFLKLLLYGFKTSLLGLPRR